MAVKMTNNSIWAMTRLGIALFTLSTLVACGVTNNTQKKTVVSSTVPTVTISLVPPDTLGGTPSASTPGYTDDTMGNIGISEPPTSLSNLLVFYAVLSSPANKDASFQIRTDLRNDTATVNTDFLTKTTTLVTDTQSVPGYIVNIDAGATFARFEVEIKDDNIYEGDEVFTLHFTDQQNISIISPTQTITIHDNDPKPQLGLVFDSNPAATTTTVPESSGAVKLIVKLNASSVFNVATKVNFTLSGIATQETPGSGNPFDYKQILPVTIPPQTQEVPLYILLQDDVALEPTEDIIISLASSADYDIDPGVASPLTINITDDESNGNLTDTGVNTCASDTQITTSCPQTGFPQTGFPNQDGEVTSAAGVEKNGSYTLVSDCVLDVATGLMWEVKVSKADTTNIRWGGKGFYWFAPYDHLNGGSPGIATTTQFSPCDMSTVDAGKDCHTQGYIYFINNLTGYANPGLCGYSNWRLPTLPELLSLVDYRAQTAPQPNTNSGDHIKRINTNVFPNIVEDLNTTSGKAEFWTSTPSTGFKAEAWVVDFLDGSAYTLDKGKFQARIRLVRTN